MYIYSTVWRAVVWHIRALNCHWRNADNLLEEKWSASKPEHHWEWRRKTRILERAFTTRIIFRVLEIIVRISKDWVVSWIDWSFLHSISSYAVWVLCSVDWRFSVLRSGAIEVDWIGWTPNEPLVTPLHIRHRPRPRYKVPQERRRKK